MGLSNKKCSRQLVNLIASCLLLTAGVSGASTLSFYARDTFSGDFTFNGFRDGVACLADPSIVFEYLAAGTTVAFENGDSFACTPTGNGNPARARRFLEISIWGKECVLDLQTSCAITLVSAQNKILIAGDCQKNALEPGTNNKYNCSIPFENITQ